LTTSPNPVPLSWQNLHKRNPESLRSTRIRNESTLAGHDLGIGLEQTKEQSVHQQQMEQTIYYINDTQHVLYKI